MRTPTKEPSGRSATTSRRRLLQATTATLGLTAGFVAGSETAVGQSEGRKEIRRGTVELIEPEEASDFEYPYLLYRPDTNSMY